MDKFDKILSTIVILFMFYYVGIFCYSLALEIGYKKGVYHTQLYHEATNEFPTKDWVNNHITDNFNYIQEILETLEPFEITR